MADLGSGGSGADGKLTLQAGDDKVAVRLFTQPEWTESLTGAAAPAAAVGAGTVRTAGRGTRIVPAGVILAGILHPASDRFELGHDGRGGVIEVKGGSNAVSVSLSAGAAAGTEATAVIGGGGHPGTLRVASADGQSAFSIAPGGDTGGAWATASIGHLGRYGQLSLRDAQGNQRLLLSAATGQLYLYDANGSPTVILDATSGDVVLSNADIAEEFDVAEDVVPGCLVRIGPAGRLERTLDPYDPTVAGIISGSGSYRPAIVLDRRPGAAARLPLAMMGKVACLVDASSRPVRPGDLLTSSSLPGHAMVASNRTRSHGAIVGKALAGLAGGSGSIPVLVGLR